MTYQTIVAGRGDRASRVLTHVVLGGFTSVMQTSQKPLKQIVAEHHYLPGRSLETDVREARSKGHSWRAIADQVNKLLAGNAEYDVTVSHEVLRQWYPDRI